MYHDPRQVVNEEHYDAQGEYADLLFKGLDISWFHPIQKLRAYWLADKLKASHVSCCDWANEEY